MVQSDDLLIKANMILDCIRYFKAEERKYWAQKLSARLHVKKRNIAPNTMFRKDKFKVNLGRKKLRKYPEKLKPFFLREL